MGSKRNVLGTCFRLLPRNAPAWQNISGRESSVSDMAGRRWRVTSWYDPRVEIRPSGIQGGGMYARAPIHAGETVAIVGGTPMTDAEFAAYRGTVERYNASQIGEDLHLVDLIQTPDQVDGSINHACDSNLW